MSAYNYNTITEVPGLMASHEQLERLYHRYRFAAENAKDKDVLEVACGSGIGLGYLSNIARKVVGGDIDPKNLAIARDLYSGRAADTQPQKRHIEIVELDAHHLRFPDGSFDLVLHYEAIYYLRDASRFITEAARVLRKEGCLIIGMVNKDWEEFLPSPFSHRYYSVPELHALMRESFSKIEFYGAFPTQIQGLLAHATAWMKRLAVRLDIIPGSLQARAFLKRIFFGPLSPLPDGIEDGMFPYRSPALIPADTINKDYKIIYAIGRK